jgi:hypothetical protein
VIEQLAMESKAGVARFEAAERRLELERKEYAAGRKEHGAEVDRYNALLRDKVRRRGGSFQPSI